MLNMKRFKIINRRNALSAILKGGIGATAAFGSLGSVSASVKSEDTGEPLKSAKKPMLMKVGCQQGGTGKQNLEYMARHGVYNLDGGSPKTIEGVGWDLDDSLAKRDACE